jgi:hypothetical protein
MGGLTREEISDDLEGSVAKGLVIPIELVQDDPLLVRVVLGDLLPEEEREWVGRVVATLRVPCGSLAVEGGLDPRSDDDSEFVEYVDVPPGDYRVEVLTYLHGINGDYCISDRLDGERIGPWFRRTRPDTEMPFWLKLLLGYEPEHDPGHEAEWDEFAEYVEGLPTKEHDELFDSESVLDFVVRLTPLEGDVEVSELDEGGWFAIDTGARKPDLCPLGIRAIVEDDS